MATTYAFFLKWKKSTFTNLIKNEPEFWKDIKSTWKQNYIYILSYQKKTTNSLQMIKYINQWKQRAPLRYTKLILTAVVQHWYFETWGILKIFI